MYKQIVSELMAIHIYNIDSGTLILRFVALEIMCFYFLIAYIKQVLHHKSYLNFI